MDTAFTKMHGLGNDFVVVDCRQKELSDPAAFAVKFCHRRFGIGADQLLLLYPSFAADFKMLIFNADGSEVEMCGNGIRCFAKYIWDRQLSTKEVIAIETRAGIRLAERMGKLIRVDMGQPVFQADKIPVLIEATAPIIDYPLQIKDMEFRSTFVSIGNPHAVIFLDDDVASFPLSLYGPEVEHHPLFPRRTNVEFVNVNNRSELTMRVWERGAGETMACGTGASASGVAAMIKGMSERKVVIHLLGGDLAIEWPEDNHVYMAGACIEVFEGIIRQ
ncbi:MAG: diaminopimelate epimerase [Dissulfurispiraceae bacterium]